MLSRGAGRISPVMNRIIALGPENAAMYGPTLARPVARRCYSSTVSSTESIICLGGPSTQASLLEAINSKEVRAEACVSIGRQSWLREAHSDWDDRPWGQCKGYLPPAMREIADELFPNYPENQLLSFVMMKYIISELEIRLVAAGVERFDGEIDYFKQNHEGCLVGVQAGSEFTFSESNNFRLLNASIEHVSPKDLSSQHGGLIYKMSKAQSTENVALVGSGANLTWICRDTPERNIVHLIPPEDRVREDLADIVHCSMRLQECSIDRAESGFITIEGPDVFSQKPMVVRVAEEMVFSAMGYRFNPSLSSQVDSRKVLDVDVSPKQADVRPSYRFFNNAVVNRPADLRGTKMPPGNLKLNYLKIQHALGAFNPSARNALLLFDAWKEVVLESAIAHKITIDEKFFDMLKPLVKHAYTNSIPSEEQVFRTVKVCYERICLLGHAAEQSGKKMSAEDFMKFVRAPTDEILDEVDTPRNDHTPQA